MLESDSQEVGPGDLFCARRSLCSIGQSLRKPDRNQNCFCHHQTLRKGPGGNCATPVLGDPPMLGKLRHPGRAAYYIVIPTKSRIFRGFGEVHRAVLQNASLRITCKPTHFRHSSLRAAVYGLPSIPLIHQSSFCRICDCYCRDRLGHSGRCGSDICACILLAGDDRFCSAA